MKMKIRKLTPSDRDSFFELTKTVVEALENKDFLIPMTKEEADDTFRDDSEDIVLGAFIDEKLVATLGLFHDIRDYAYELPNKYLTLKGAEIGEAMVFPDFRRNGLMNQLVEALQTYIQSSRLDYLLATAHPDNVSNHLIIKADFNLLKVFERRGYTRNMYIKELHRV